MNPRGIRFLGGITAAILLHAGGPAGTGTGFWQYAFKLFREDELLTNDFE